MTKNLVVFYDLGEWKNQTQNHQIYIDDLPYLTDTNPK